jgi:hypothetical protein
MKKGLSRFIGFCELNSIPPTRVSDGVSDRFRVHLEADTNVPSPPDRHRLTCRLWNQAAETVPGWPMIKLSVADNRRPRRSLPISAFPVSLQEELERYLDSLGGGDLFAEEATQRRMARSTVRQRGVELGLALSALVGSGSDPASITSLACLVEPSAFTSVLRHYLKDGKPRPFAHNIAQTLITLAKRWVKLDSASLDKLKGLQGRLGTQRKGLTEKNRALLRTLDDPEVRARLLFLPDRLANWAEFPNPAKRVFGDPGRSRRRTPACTGPIGVGDAAALLADIDHLKIAGFQKEGADLAPVRFRT